MWHRVRGSLLQTFCWRQGLLTLRQTILNGLRLRAKKFKARMAAFLHQKVFAIGQTTAPTSYVRRRPCVRVAKPLRTRCLPIGKGTCPKLFRGIRLGKSRPWNS